ncbi:MAG: diacylglycerol kinase family protein, partial [Methylocystaceae bacterium]
MADSFYYAGRGLIYALVSQRNMKIHSLAAIIVIAAGFFFQVSSLEWVMLIL